MTMDNHIDLPQTRTFAKWFRQFETEIAARVKPPFHAQVLCAIACKETGGILSDWFERDLNLSTDEILSRCVFDRGPEAEDVGEANGKERRVYPNNTARFRRDFGTGFTDMLIEEGRKTRRIRLKSPARTEWIYMGYGLFQFDLQYVQKTSDFGDESFFRNKKWYDFSACLDKAATILEAKYRSYPTLWDAVEAYNGRGNTGYRNAVKEMYGWIMADWPTADA